MSTVPSNPGWYTGYVPSSVEWANQWSSKVDFPAPIDQGGTGAQSVPAANSNLQQRFLIDGGLTITAQTLSWYGLRTSNGPVVINLPELSSVTPGDWIELLDVDYYASTNNIQLFCTGSDSLRLWGLPGTTALFNISGTRILIIANLFYWSISTW